MARGQQKIQSQQKNAKKQAEQKKKQGHDQKAAAKAALIYTCTVCRVRYWRAGRERKEVLPFPVSSKGGNEQESSMKHSPLKRRLEQRNGNIREYHQKMKAQHDVQDIGADCRKSQAPLTCCKWALPHHSFPCL
ncbi:zinc finger protein 706 isoform X3 [Numida meleagris]|uniref:zinc finger protein 706 isoform X3 n=1 Tax=Numida meleagris TaxID=8996 RepID=UPI000B3DD684|nr:zinc finger protein 706 isoform X3 [Numida meleagris]